MHLNYIWQAKKLDNLKEMDTLRVHRRHPGRKLTAEEQNRQNARLLYAASVKVPTYLPAVNVHAS